MGKHEKVQDKKFRIYIVFILHIISWLILIYSLVKIFKWNIDNKQNEDIMQEISNSIVIVDTQEEEETQEEQYEIDFATLKQTNNNTVAFLKVNGTEISHPIVQAKDNEFYLKHSFDKSYNAAGWIFADYKNKFDGTDKNIVIYGHNRKNGTMFSSLKNILKQEWNSNQENLKIQLITEDEKSIYEVFSVYQIEKEEYYIQTEFKSEEDFSKFIKTLKSRSIKSFECDVTAEDKVLTLSTCANDNNYRVVLHAKKVS